MVVYFYFMNAAVRQIKMISTKYITALAVQAEMIQQTMIMTHVSFKEYAKANPSHEETMATFGEADRILINKILEVK